MQRGAPGLLCLQTLWLKDKGAPHSAEAAMCKWWAPKLGCEIIQQCLLTHGHGGYGAGSCGFASDPAGNLYVMGFRSSSSATPRASTSSRRSWRR